jgi:hypothetical protein
MYFHCTPFGNWSPWDIVAWTPTAFQACFCLFQTCLAYELHLLCSLISHGILIIIVHIPEKAKWHQCTLLCNQVHAVEKCYKYFCAKFDPKLSLMLFPNEKQGCFFDSLFFSGIHDGAPFVKPTIMHPFPHSEQKIPLQFARVLHCGSKSPLLTLHRIIFKSKMDLSFDPRLIPPLPSHSFAVMHYNPSPGP